MLATQAIIILTVEVLSFASDFISTCESFRNVCEKLSKVWLLTICHQTRTADKVLNRLASLVGNFSGQNPELSDSRKMFQWQRVVRSRLYSQWAIYREGCNPFHLCISLTSPITETPLATIGDQIVDTLFLNGVYSFREQNNPQPPLSLPFKVGVFVVFYK